MRFSRGCTASRGARGCHFLEEPLVLADDRSVLEQDLPAIVDLAAEMLVAKRDLKLSRVLKRFSRYEVLLIDDIGYVQQNREQMEVLFTLLAERYERGTVMLTSNLPFSKVGGDLQGLDDDGGHRPPGASQRDLGVEHSELPTGGGQADQAARGGVSNAGGGKRQ